MSRERPEIREGSVVYVDIRGGQITAMVNYRRGRSLEVEDVADHETYEVDIDDVTPI